MVDAVRIDGLVLEAGSRRIVDELSLQAPAHAVTAIVGPNGAGKTSTIEACMALRPRQAGTITLLGERVANAPVAGTSVMLQDGGLYPTARPYELLTYLASLYPQSLPPAELLQRVGIDPASRATVRRMSGGEQQRLKAAAALIGKPRLAFLDEPTAGLDASGRQILHDLVRELVTAGASVVITTHLMDDVEALADRVVVMSHGQVVAQAPLSELIGSPDSVWFDARPMSDLSALRELLPKSTITEHAPGRYCASHAAESADLAGLAQWCAAQSAPAAITHVGTSPLSEVVQRILASQEAS